MAALFIISCLHLISFLLACSTSALTTRNLLLEIHKSLSRGDTTTDTLESWKVIIMQYTLEVHPCCMYNMITNHTLCLDVCSVMTRLALNAHLSLVVVVLDQITKPVLNIP